MSLATLERAIAFSAREIFKNKKFRVKDIREWSTSEIKPQDGEVTAYLKDPGVYVTIFKQHDKR